ncbi:hypothetical protein HZ326_22996 [Fusarium oxysporum f. sp. albedinis]|nr:hypothetical protein FOMA001_g3954 [Fusarium oxysporum f. sp. matthiolae]KAJ0126121.1 Uncharacterized protein HZ326_30775 [Fusarium oxysporum f. sp. albedinis]KAJ0133956.1 hypothetical protein HZ326_22996 [Fusarium oxysporum f. sp. albedinis]KAK2480519.1 hypothetical protein H9L39_06158 [Fusarium oxysporum f. sp. albedinis]
MSRLQSSAIVLLLWTIQGSQGRVISEPTQRLYAPSHDRLPAQTNMMEIPLPLHVVKRQITSSSDDALTVTIAPDETCGWLSGRAGVPITCENRQPCMWMKSIALICGPLNDYRKWEYHLMCYERAEALNTDICNDLCVSGHTLRCTEESAAYCRTYAYPDGVQDYRCVSTPETRASSVFFTYKDQKDAGLVTATYNNADSQVVSTEFVSSTTSASSSNAAPSSSSTTPPSPSPPPSSRNNIGAIIGAAIGGFVALSVVSLAIFWFVRRSKQDGAQQVTPMEQTQLNGTPLYMNARKPDSGPGPGSSVQSEWRSSMITVPIYAGDSASPQGWMNESGSPGAQSSASQGVSQLIPQPVPYEMSGDSLQTEGHSIMRDPTRSQVYEMVGDSPHSWIP